MNCDKSKEYCKLKIWCNDVIERDKSCQKCGKENNLEAHHIRRLKVWDTHYFDKEYGVTLCHNCHMEFHERINNHYFNQENTVKYLLGLKDWDKVYV